MSSTKLGQFFVRLIVIGIPLCIVLVIAVRYIDTLISPHLGSNLSKVLLTFIALLIFYSVIGKSLKEAVDEQKRSKKREKEREKS